jgi:pimeloyl-ACP methyl ester carboxylesterase
MVPPSRIEYSYLICNGRRGLYVLPSVRKVVENHYKSSKLFVIANCGHVVNVEQPNAFNDAVLSFINTAK